MCRNIRTLFNFEPPATENEIQAASVQVVRKISGATKPSKANEAAFATAVDDVSAVVRDLLATLVTTVPPKDREVQAAKSAGPGRATFWESWFRGDRINAGC